MMAELSPIPIELKGPRGHAELTDFVNVITALRASIKHACRCITGTDDIECDVVGLRHASAHLDALPVTNGVSSSEIAEMTDAFDRTLSALENGGEPDPRFDYGALQAISRFSNIVKKPGSFLAVCGTRLTMSFVERVQSLLVPERQSSGSVTGRLEGVNIHGNNVFTLYPPLANSKIDCEFSRDDIKRVLDSVARNVTVFGTLHYAKSSAFPIKVEVVTFEVLPDAESLPTLLNDCGVMHSVGSSVDMIRESRNGW